MLGNYAGDVMNFEMAAEMLEGPVATVLTNDDVAVEDSTWTQGRRGVAGTLIVEKMVGAAAERGADLESLRDLGERVNSRTRTMGVALSSCTVPAAGVPTFVLGENEMELGVGIHGEPSRQRVALQPADGIAELLLGPVLADLALPRGAEVLLLVNGFGGTPLLELYGMVQAAHRVLDGAGVRVVRHLTGSYVTSLEMAGCSLSLCLPDADLLALWDAPVHTAALRWGM